MNSIRSTLRNIPHLLWIEPSQAIRKMLESRLQKIPYHFVHSLQEAALFLEDHAVDALIFSEDAHKQQDFLSWLKDYYPLITPLMITDRESSAIDETTGVLALSRQSLLKSPETVVLSSVQHTDFQGELRNVSLIDLTRLLALSDSGKRLKIYDPAHEQHGELFFKNRSLMTAELGNTTGEKALANIMALEKGFFAELPWKAPEQQDFYEPYDALMMKAAQYLDESVFAGAPSRKGEEKQTLNILTIDHNKLTQQMYQAFFSRYGHLVQPALKSSEALRLLENHRYDVILLEIALEDEKGKYLIEEIKSRGYQGKLIIVSETDSKAVRQYCMNKGAIKFFSKPLSLKELYTFLRYLFTQRSFRGTLKYFSLLDLLQLLTLSNQNHRIQITQGKEKGWMYFSQGQLIAANYEQFEGEEACFHILALKSGAYKEHPWTPPLAVNVRLSTGQLLLKAANFAPPVVEKVAIENKTDFGKELVLLKELKQIFDLPVNDDTGSWGPLSLGKTQLSSLIGEAHTPLDECLSCFLSMGVELKFSHEGKLEQLGLLNTFLGKTDKGLQTNIPTEEAIKIYGEPQYQDKDCVIWDQACAFLEKGRIDRIYFGAL